MTEPVPADPSLASRTVAVETYNRCWDLLESERDADADAELLTVAFTSRYHWLTQDDAQAHAMADWMVSRAAAAAGHGRLAVDFARRAVAATTGPDVPAWLRASVLEGLARAHAADHDADGRAAALAAAERELARETDDEDRQLIADQLATVPPA